MFRTLVDITTKKINCWEFVKCGRECGEKNISGSGVCRASLDISKNGINGGKNGGRICWAVSGTFCGERMDGNYAKKLLSCRSCDFFHRVRDEEGTEFVFMINNFSNSMAEAAESI